ncbi:MAG: ice-binding family protein [Chloroflexota bacterium]
MTTLPVARKRIVGLVLIFGVTVLLGVSLILPSRVHAQTSPTLGDSASFAVIGGQTVTNTGPTVVNGDLGISPGGPPTGFPPGVVTPPGKIYAADGIALAAQNDATAAYNTLSSEACTSDLTGQDLGGMTLTTGVYCFDTSAQLTGALTLDAGGSADAVFVFKMNSTLTTATASSVLLTNGGSDCNIWWQVGSSATIGTATSFAGNIMALASITLTTGANVSGRAFAQTGAVTMDSNTVGTSACIATPPERPELSLTKNDGGVTVRQGDTISYTLTYGNTGNVDLVSPILSDTLPADTTFNAGASTAGWDCSASPCVLTLPTLAAGDTGSAVFAVTVNNPTDTSLISNSATITSGDTSETATDTTPVTRPSQGPGPTAVPALIFTAVPTESSASAQSAVSGLPNTGGGAPQPTYWMTPQPGR